MVLNNILADCELLSNLFKDLKQFTTSLENYKAEVVYNYSNIILNLSKDELSYKNNISIEDIFVPKDDTSYLNIIFDLAKKITICSFSTTETITNFSHLRLYSDTLNKQLKNFLDYTKEFITMCNNFSSYENNDYTKFTYAHKVHIKFEETYNYYITLYLNFSFFQSIAAELYNEVPEQIQNNPEYTELNIQSNKKTSDLITMSKDIELVSNMIINIQALLPEDEPKDYYIQKVESGSIFVSIIAVTALIKIIIATVDYGATIYYKLKNNQINLKMKQTEVNKEEFRLSLLKKYQELGFNVENNGENLEQIEKIITTTIKYLDSNPSGKLNNEKYNIETQTTILTDKILQNTPVNEIAD